MVTKFGTKGAINLGKAVPVVGAIIGGSFDTITTKSIGALAKNTFSAAGVDVGDGVILDRKTVNDVTDTPE